MKRLLGLLLVMGMLGCGGGKPKWVERDGLMYEGDSETPFTGVVVEKHENGQKKLERTFKDGKKEGPTTRWYKNGQKLVEGTYKDGKQEGLSTAWHENGQKMLEVTFKDGKLEGLATEWRENGQKKKEETHKDGKKVFETSWDKDGLFIKRRY